MNRKGDAIDIVIPVYNGYEDVRLCIDSIKKHTNLERNRVLLINDCSPDERIAPYLNRQAEKNIIVMHNEANQGFSANVNKGMLYSERDVILLNADTIVTAGWVEKIQACAYQAARTATVTPLSNSATLCSVPVMCQDNQVPEHMTVDAYASLIERCSLRRYPRITVAVGFCMYIKQNVIEEAGLFDARTFERGYGEENDFCNRAEQLGYQHVMCDDTFIYHKGTASFDTEEKIALCEAHDKILQERYPKQMRRNHLYCLENPDQEIRDNINMYTKLFNGRKNILYLLHLDFQTDSFNNIGGTQLHVRDLMTALREKYNIFVAARDKDCLRVTGYTDKDEVSLKFEIGEAEDFTVFYDDKLKKIYREVLGAFQIDLIHVHHTVDLSLDIFHVAKEFQIPVVATMHDYYYACPTVKLLDEEEKFCPSYYDGLDESSQKERCVKCLHVNCGLAEQVNFQDKWRKENERALTICEKLIFPSDSAKDEFIRIFPGLKMQATVIAHGSEKVQQKLQLEDFHGTVEKSKKVKLHLDRMPGSKRGFNYVAGWAYFEGIDNKDVGIYLEVTDRQGKLFFVRARKKARRDVVSITGVTDYLWSGIHMVFSIPDMAEGACKFRVLLDVKGKYYTDGRYYNGNYQREQGEPGRLNVAFIGGMVPAKGSRMVAKLLQMPTDKINWFVMGAIGDNDLNALGEQGKGYFSGVYEKDDIYELLKTSRIDVVCVLPVWAETFCYTVSEAWLCGIPVIGTDVGAVGERIKETQAGWVVKLDSDAEDILDLLHYLKEHPEDVVEKKRIIRSMQIRTVAEMCDEYERFYETLIMEHPAKGGRQEVDFDFVFQGLALGDPGIRGRGTYASLNMLREENKRVKEMMERIQGTVSYRMARKISGVRVPFRGVLKKVFGK